MIDTSPNPGLNFNNWASAAVVGSTENINIISQFFLNLPGKTGLKICMLQESVALVLLINDQAYRLALKSQKIKTFIGFQQDT